MLPGCVLFLQGPLDLILSIHVFRFSFHIFSTYPILVLASCNTEITGESPLYLDLLQIQASASHSRFQRVRMFLPPSRHATPVQTLQNGDDLCRERTDRYLLSAKHEPTCTFGVNATRTLEVKRENRKPLKMVFGFPQYCGTHSTLGFPNRLAEMCESHD